MPSAFTVPDANEGLHAVAGLVPAIALTSDEAGATRTVECESARRSRGDSLDLVFDERDRLVQVHVSNGRVGRHVRTGIACAREEQAIEIGTKHLETRRCKILDA